jgi:Putative DNA-binding domain
MADNLLHLVQRLSTRLSKGEDIEEDKIEIKRQWSNLAEPEQLHEFLKDIVSLANTPGLTGYLIIGLDNKGVFFDSPFGKSGLRDQSDLHNLIVRYVDLPFRIQINQLPLIQDDKEITICVLEVPPSLEKPHFIRRHVTKSGNEIQNFIPVRKTNGIFSANRSDVEFMYYDRKNIEPDYALSLYSHRPHLGIRGASNQIIIDFQLAFQNYGRRPIALVESTMTVLAAPESGIPNDIPLQLVSYAESGMSERRSHISLRYLKVPSNQVEALMVTYLGTAHPDLLASVQAAESLKFSVSAIDTNDNTYHSEIMQGVPK